MLRGSLISELVVRYLYVKIIQRKASNTASFSSIHMFYMPEYYYSYYFLMLTNNGSSHNLQVSNNKNTLLVIILRLRLQP